MPTTTETDRHEREACSDEELMLRAGHGDADAFEVLVERHWKRAWRTAYRFLGQQEESEDVTQDAFMKILRAASRYRPKALFTTYLYRVVSRLCIDRVKKKRPLYSDNVPDVETDDADSFAALKNEETADYVRKAIDSLPPEQRMAIVLRYYEDLGYTGISTALGKSKKSVERLLARARTTLKNNLREAANR